MKKNKLIVSAAICLVAGLVIFGIGFWIADFNIKNLSCEEEYTEKTYDSSEMYNAIVVTEEDTNVDIVKSEDDSFHISYFENEKRQYEINDSNDTLTLTVEDKHNWRDYVINLNFNEKKTTIEVPEAFYGKIFTQTSNCDISISDVKTTDIETITSNDDVNISEVTCDGTLTATSSNGNIDIEKTQIGGNAELKTSSNKMYITDVVCNGTLNATNSNADIIVDNTQIESDAKFKTSNNDIELTNTTCGNLIVDTDNGNVDLSNVLSKTFLNITTSNDDVTFNSVEFGKGLDCKNSNGNVKGTIVGEAKDFSITSKTSNGDNNLPEKFIAGEKIMKIKTSNDDIEIQFTK